VSRYQQTFPPRGDTCLALTEFITGSWTSVYDNGNTGPLSLFPIVLGFTTESETQGGWNTLQLPRPTMSAKLGTGEWQACPTNPLLTGFSKNILLAATASYFQDARLKYGCGEDCVVNLQRVRNNGGFCALNSPNFILYLRYIREGWIDGTPILKVRQ